MITDAALLEVLKTLTPAEQAARRSLIGPKRSEKRTPMQRAMLRKLRSMLKRRARSRVPRFTWLQGGD